MHLLVLSAFRHGSLHWARAATPRLNAPFGAQCFPTAQRNRYWIKGLSRLNAPFGAQCFPTLKTFRQ